MSTGFFQRVILASSTLMGVMTVMLQPSLGQDVSQPAKLEAIAEALDINSIQPLLDTDWFDVSVVNHANGVRNYVTSVDSMESAVVSIEEARGKITSANMEVQRGRTIACLDREGDHNGYVLALFIAKQDGSVFRALYDLNFDGVWDCRDDVDDDASLASHIRKTDGWCKVTSRTSVTKEFVYANVNGRKFEFVGEEWQYLDGAP